MAEDIEVLHPSLVLRTKETPNPEALGLREEFPGWHGYVEWEKYPEKKKEVKEFDFPGAPEFQLVPLPKINPLLESARWKQYHYALGNAIKDIPAESWLFVEKEKAPDMIHVLQFPYNGELQETNWLPLQSPETKTISSEITVGFLKLTRMRVSSMSKA